VTSGSKLSSNDEQEQMCHGACVTKSVIPQKRLLWTGDEGGSGKTVYSEAVQSGAAEAKPPECWASF
jgi:hypothetical protein